jgi:hypothetical protein
MNAMVWSAAWRFSRVSHRKIVEITRQVAAAAALVNQQSGQLISVMPFINLVPALGANPIGRHKDVVFGGVRLRFGKCLERIGYFTHAAILRLNFVA